MPPIIKMLFHSVTRSALLICLITSTLPAKAEEAVLSSYRIDHPTSAQLDQIARDYEIVTRRGDSYEVNIPRHHSQNLLRIAPQSQLIESDIRAAFLREFTQDATLKKTYRSYDEIYEHLQELTSQYPDLVKLEEYGRSKKNNPLYAVHLKGQNSESKPTLLLDAATHGDEVITTEVLLRILDELVSGYGNVDEITRFIDRANLLVVPVVNPDGYISGNRYESGYDDPNRSYPYPENPSRRPVPCIAALIDLAQRYQISGSIDLHAYGEMIMYPWAYTRGVITNKTDLAAFDDLTAKMSLTNGYAHGQISKVIYVAVGSSADYYYWKLGTVALAIEIGKSKAPPASQISRELEAIRPAIYTFLHRFTDSN